MKFRDFIKILEAHGFALKTPRTPGSHDKYIGSVNGQTQIVIVACHSTGDDIAKGTMGSMIRQSGLPKKTFR